jgi:hypothetical protein
MDASHPLYEAAVVIVDVVDMEARVFGLWIGGRGKGVDLQLGAFREGGDGRAAVAAKISRSRNSFAERFLQAGGAAASIPGSKRRLTEWFRQPEPDALEHERLWSERYGLDRM